ncbi:MAG: polysaccharide deacetylase family protein [Janthinobacterium lividum]
MLTHRRARWVLVSAEAAVTLLWWLVGVSLWWLALPLAAYVGVVAYGSARISSSFFIETLCGATTTRPHIALTFDDGPVATTPAVLDILARHGVPATFFCIGQRVRANSAVVQQIAAAGHLVGNHSFTHHFFIDLFSTRQLSREISTTDAAIAAAIGRKPRLFRPPYGVTTPSFARAIRRAGHRCIGWNVRSLDTVVRDEQQLLGNMVRALAPGAVFLFHDSSATTVGMLDAFIQHAQQRGFRIVPLDQLLGISPYV